MKNKEEKQLIRRWIISEVLPYVIDKYSTVGNTYCLKHKCERVLGFYVSENDITEQLEALGVTVKKGHLPLDKKFWNVKYI